MGINSGMAITLSGGIASNIFDSLVAWISGCIAGVLDGFGTAFTNIAPPNLENFSDLFPFMKTAYEVVVYFGFALLFLIVVWQLFKTFGGKYTDGEDPAILTVRAMLFAVLIAFSWDIMNYVMNIAMVPYDVFNSLSSKEITESAVKSLLENNDLKLTKLIGIVLGAFTTATSIIGIIATVVLLWNYLKLLLEVCERYVVLGVLAYTSPLAFSLGASKSTSDVFKNWCRMVGSQLFIIVMNVYFLKGFNVALSAFLLNMEVLEEKTDGSGAVILLVGYFCLLAYLRVAARFDEYLSQLGLNAAKTGTGPLGGLMPMMVGRTILSSVMGGRGFFGHGGGGFAGAGAGAASKVLGVGGIGTIPSRAANAFNPSTYVGNALGGKKQGFGGIAGGIANMAGRAYASTHGLGDTGLISGLANSTDKSLNGIGGKAGLNDAQMFMPGLFGRQGLTFDAASQRNTAGQMAGQFTDENGNTFGVVASSMKANEVPNGAFGTMRAVDGSGFYIQTFDKDGNVSEQGMATLFGAPSIGDGAGQTPAGDFANTFFPGQEGVTNGLTFTNDENDPFILHATDADGHTFDLFNSAGYEKPENAIEGMTPTDVNGNDWFVCDTTPLNTDGIVDGVTISGDGVITDSFGNVVSDSSLENVGVASQVGEIGDSGVPSMTEDGVNDSVFGATFFPSEDTEGLTFSNVDSDPYSFKMIDEDGNKSIYRSGAEYGVPAVQGDVMTDVNDNKWYEDTGVFNSDAGDHNNMTISTDDPYTMSVQPSDGNGNPVLDENNVPVAANDYVNLAGGDLPEGSYTDEAGQTWVPAPDGYNDNGTLHTNEDGQKFAPAYKDDYGQTWVPAPDGHETTSPFDSSTYEASFNPVNPYEATIHNSETGETNRYQHEALGNKGRASEDSAITDLHGNKWYPVGNSGDDRSQIANIEKSNASV
ncbi:MAG: hypothetical protein UGF89_10450, partial [Acutalibacteraceae bacterium]|nr:hypothetical protein [Acutalibacteraceae bacterium]